MSTTTTNTGGSQRSIGFEPKPDGIYTYHHEGSMSAQAPGMWAARLLSRAMRGGGR